MWVSAQSRFRRCWFSSIAPKAIFAIIYARFGIDIVIQVVVGRQYTLQARAAEGAAQTITLAEQLEYARQIAVGMGALARQHIVHRDMAAFVGFALI